MTNYRALIAELAGCLDDALTFTVQGDTERSMRQLVDRARALLSQPEPEVAGPLPSPVPVAERLPGQELCWWYEPDDGEDDGYGGSWILLRIRGGTRTYSHWLPHDALPVPGAEVG